MKYVLVLTLPSGAEFAASQMQGRFAMIPLKDNRVTNVLCWNTPKEVFEFLKKWRVDIGEEKFKKILALNPKVVPMMPEH